MRGEAENRKGNSSIHLFNEWSRVRMLFLWSTGEGVTIDRAKRRRIAVTSSEWFLISLVPRGARTLASPSHVGELAATRPDIAREEMLQFKQEESVKSPDGSRLYVPRCAHRSRDSVALAPSRAHGRAERNDSKIRMFKFPIPPDQIRTARALHANWP